MENRRVTLVDVAKLANVSPTTVSRVLSGSRPVAPELITRVQAAKDALGYRHNKLARGLRTRASDVIGVVIPDIGNPFFTALVRGIEDLARERDYLLILCNTDETHSREMSYLEMLADEQAAGVVLSPAPYAAEFDVISALSGVPVVLVDRVIPGFTGDSVGVNNFSATYDLTTHLLQFDSRLGFISGPLTTSTSRERVEGFKSALSDNGVTFSTDRLIEADNLELGGFIAAKKLLQSADPPHGILAGNNLMARGALRALLEEGVDIDRYPFGVFGSPLEGMSSERHAGLMLPTYELGRQAGELLLDRIQGNRAAGRSVRLAATLVRGSALLK